MICKILLSDGEDVCLDMVKAGMAWHYKQYQDEQTAAERVSYAAAECIAMKARVGLWSDPHPVQPQDFRHGTVSPILLDAQGCRISSEPVNGPVVGNERSTSSNGRNSPITRASRRTTASRLAARRPPKPRAIARRTIVPDS